MTDDYTVTDTDPADVLDSDASAIIAVTTAAAEPKPLDDSGRFMHVAVPAGGGSRVIDLVELAESHNDGPNRKRGHYAAHDADTFVGYLGKHGDSDSEVWASHRDRRIVGVINAHRDVKGSVADDTGFTAGWEDHRISYTATPTPAWAAWTARDGSLGDQGEFADHIEDRMSDIVRPSSLDMLEVAQTFRASVGAQFQQSQRLSSGERKFVFDETVAASAGMTGEVEVPERFTIRVAPFEGADVVDVDCLLKFRVRNGVLSIGYRIIQREEVERDAFTTVVAGVQNGIADFTQLDGVTVYLGTPA